jgi:hypothetical protein
LLGTWWVRGELKLILEKEEVLGLIPVGEHIMRWWIEGEGGQQVLKVKKYFKFYI